MRGAPAANIHIWSVVVIATAALISLGAWLYLGRSTGASNPSLILVVSGDTAGWIVPCGCASNQSGGLPRRGTYIANLRDSADVIYADAGGAPGGDSEYHRARFEAILQGEIAMGIDGHNLGGPEARLGADYIRNTSANLRMPFISANVTDAGGQLIGEPFRIVERGGRRVALTGVLSARSSVQGLTIADPRDAILRAINPIQGKYDSLIVLAYLPEDELRQLAAALPEADAIIGGPTGQSIAPKMIGPTTTGAATNKGKFLVELKATAAQHPVWSGQVVEMTEHLRDNEDQQKSLKAYLRRLDQRDFSAAETGMAPALPAALPTDFRLAGNAACMTCHEGDCDQWRNSKHAVAWHTLAQRGYHVDSYCQQCHTTGFGLPGGFESARRSHTSRDVGCESCHGPASSHVRDPKIKTLFTARDQCVRCHDHENSPTFDYAGYWSRIVHGVPPHPMRVNP
jgi:hypothetical protein